MLLQLKQKGIVVTVDLKGCYKAIEGDYEDVIARFRSEKVIEKFVFKFLSDPSYDLLCRSLEEGNYQEAFRAAHTNKGICQNLSFNRLYVSSNRLTEMLRLEQRSDITEMVKTVKEDYQRTSDAIRSLQAEVQILQNFN